MLLPVLRGKRSVIEMRFRPPCDRREVARDVCVWVLEGRHFLPEDVLRDLRRFLARV